VCVLDVSDRLLGYYPRRLFPVIPLAGNHASVLMSRVDARFLDSLPCVNSLACKNYRFACSRGISSLIKMHSIPSPPPRMRACIMGWMTTLSDVAPSKDDARRHDIDHSLTQLSTCRPLSIRSFYRIAWIPLSSDCILPSCKSFHTSLFKNKNISLCYVAI
jgi:hypothetical protein